MVVPGADDAAEQLLIVEEFEQLLGVLAARPYQFTFIAVLMIGCGRMAGVHSTV